MTTLFPTLEPSVPSDLFPGLISEAPKLARARRKMERLEARLLAATQKKNPHIGDYYAMKSLECRIGWMAEEVARLEREEMK